MGIIISLLFTLIGISFPLFYLYGLISFLHNRSKSTQTTPQSKKPHRAAFLALLIKELKSHPPQTQASDLTQSYQSELDQLHQLSKAKTQSPTQKNHNSILTQPIHPTQIFENWYSDNSINALLYLGAFLIVTSASIFVGFQWQTFDNFFKAIIITLFTLLWFIFGTWFFSLPKIKSAGLTFISIGCLLIPFTGLGWHNFVLKSLDVNFGYTWLVTSLVSLAVYLIFSKLTSSRLFTYLWGTAILSTALSVTHVLGLPKTFYSLSASLTGLSLTFIHLLIYIKNPKSIKTLLQPLEHMIYLSSIGAAIVGLNYLISTGNIFIFEAVINLAIISLTFFLFYIFSKTPHSLTTTLIFVLLTVLFALNWLKLEPLLVLYSLDLLAFLYLGIAWLLKRSNKNIESQAAIIIATFITIAVYITSPSIINQEFFQALFAFTVTILSLFVAIFFEYNPARYISNLFLFLAFFHLTELSPHKQLLLPLVNIGLTYALYAGSNFFQDKQVTRLYKNFTLLASITYTLYFFNQYLLLSPSKDPLIASTYIFTAYSTSFLFILESITHKDTRYRYFTSTLALLTFFWQIHHLGITQLQAYSLTLGIYLLTIAQFRLKAKDYSNFQNLDYLGLSIIIGATLRQTTYPNGYIYALILGIYGILLVFSGISIKHNTHLYAGIISIILAVLTQIYDYLLSLPRWLVTGLTGIAIITIAVILLLKRKEPHSQTLNSQS